MTLVDERKKTRATKLQSICYLTEFDETLAKLEFGQKAAVLRVGRPFERRERDEQMMFGRIDDHVALLAAIASNQGSAGIRSVENINGVQWATKKQMATLLASRQKSSLIATE